MNDREIDEILRQAAGDCPAVDPALLHRIAKSVEATVRPVPRRPPASFLAIGLVLISGAVAVAGATRSGFYGIEKLSGYQRALIFPLLAVLLWLTAATSVHERIPGSRRAVAPGFLLAGACLALLSIFALLFHDYHTERFVSQGIICLATGLLYAALAAIGNWLLLRRGFSVNPIAAGLAAGALAGLAGLTMLELHCANFETLHVMLWHTAVLPFSSAAAVWTVSTRRK